jgi:chromosome segregation ATPase
MKPAVQKILTKLAKQEQKQIDKKLEKVELARNPAVIRKNAESLDTQITKRKDRLDKVFMSYRKAWNEFQSFLDETENKAQRLDRDASDVLDALQELGVDYTKVPELSNAFGVIGRIEDDVKNLRKLYSKPE